MPRAALGIVVALIACTASPGNEEGDVCFPDEKCDSATSSSVTPTIDRTVTVLDAYNAITDHAMSSCVSPVGNASYIAGQASETVDLVYLENHSSVDVATSIALGLGLDFGLVQVSALSQLLRSVSTKSTSISVLVRMSAEYWVLNRSRLALEPWAAGKISTGIGPFVKSCGTQYANGVRYGGYVYALVTFDATDTQTIESVKSGLGLTLFGIVPLSAGLQQKMTTAAQQHSVSVTMHFAADGFILDGHPASAPLLSSLLGNGIGPAFFASLDHVREQLEQSVNGDKCRDGGLGTCDGSPAPGYANNTLRNARPSGVLKGAYDSLNDGVPPDVEARWADIDARVASTELYLKNLQVVQDRADKVSREIGGVLADRYPEMYQLLPPARPVTRASDLIATVTPWRDRFAPGGSARQPIHDAAEACYRAAVDLSECADISPVAQSVTAAIGQYAASARAAVAKWTMFVSSDVATSDVDSFCSTGRLPMDDEARFLSPLIASAWFEDHHVWVYGNRCTAPDRPAFEVDPVTGTTRLICGRRGGILTNDDRFAAICVPNGGPIPTAPSL